MILIIMWIFDNIINKYYKLYNFLRRYQNIEKNLRKYKLKTFQKIIRDSVNDYAFLNYKVIF